MKNNAIVINEQDNVAVATRDIKTQEMVGIGGRNLLAATQDISAGHKIALEPVPIQGKVFKYGEAIVRATQPIGQGEWVHVHNTEPIPGDVVMD